MKKKFKVIMLSLLLVIFIFANNLSAALVPGDHGGGPSNDAFLKVSELSTFTVPDLIIKSNISLYYSEYYGDFTDIDSTTPEGEEQLRKAVTISDADVQRLRNTKEVGSVIVDVNYEISQLQDLGYTDYKGTFELNVNIVDENSTSWSEDMSTSAAVALNAKSFSINIADLTKLDANYIKNNPEIAFKAWDTINDPVADLAPGQDLSNKLVVDNNQLNAIKNAKKAGIFPLTFSIKHALDFVQTRTVFVSVLDENSIIDKDNNIFITKDIVTIDQATAKVITADELKALANVHVYNYTTGVEQDLNNVMVEIAGLNDFAKTDLKVDSEYIVKAKYDGMVKVVSGFDIKTIVTVANNGGTDNKPTTPPLVQTGTTLNIIAIISMVTLGTSGLVIAKKRRD